MYCVEFCDRLREKFHFPETRVRPRQGYGVTGYGDVMDEREKWKQREPKAADDRSQLRSIFLFLVIFC